MKIALLLTGNELMTGDTVDSNSAMIAQSLAVQGFDVAHKVTVGDDIDLIVAELDKLAAIYPAIIINGGLGPTVDDLTSEALSMLAAQPLAENAEALAHVNEWCERRGVAANAANLKQTLLPVNSSVLANPIGSAVGISMRYKECLLLCTPGVPPELAAMLEGSVLSALQTGFPDATARLVRRLKLFGMGESSLQQIIADQCPHWPSEVVVGFRAGAPLLELKLEIEDEAHLALRDQCEAELRKVVGDFIVGENDDTLGAIVIALLQQQNKQLTLAESCTGGMIASNVTAISGASSVFGAGFVSYSNAVKTSVLGVDAALIDTHGAVSEPVARAMAEGALERSEAHCVIAVTGIAGPEGGTDEKPVGSVWVAWGGVDNINAHLFHYPVGRKMFQTMVSALALDLLRRYLLGSSDVPNYFQRKRIK
ncbi:CinA family nicotinamide mononucleotide deamidase-related protein [Pseudomonadales bacterium]|nr:CinA family nicotinamide mononucleotide deamidase-related protein [Pseudomonadales bacterium]